MTKVTMYGMTGEHVSEFTDREAAMKYLKQRVDRGGTVCARIDDEPELWVDVADAPGFYRLIPKSERDQRTVTIRLRLTQAEREQVDAAAADTGVTLSQYIRSKIL